MGMLELARVIVSVTMVAMGVVPVVSAVVARWRYGALGARPLCVLVGYCLVVGLVFLVAILSQFPFGPPDRLQIALRRTVPFVLCMLLLTGPWLGGYLVCAVRRSLVDVCHRCLYDLTGNESGICPECGTAVGDERGDGQPNSAAGGRSPWRRIAMWWFVGLVILFVFGGAQETRCVRYCTQCGQTALYHSYDLAMPFLGYTLIRGPEEGGVRVPGNPLSKYLDPEGNCAHTWRYAGSRSDCVTYPAARYSYGNPANLGYADEQDFSEFLADHPQVLDEIRLRLPGPKYELKNYVEDVRRRYLERLGSRACADTIGQ
jgi:hypothetical protein